MNNASSLIRTLLIYSICLPLAVFVGYTVTDPLNKSTFIVLGLVLCFLASPLLLRWHRLLLFAAWNFTAVLFFLPGTPDLWMAFVWLSLLISVLHYILNPRVKFLSVPSVTRPLVFLAVVVAATAKLNGGIGLGALGSEMEGGKKYIYILCAIAGYFAIISQRIPPRRAGLYVALFFLGLVSMAIGELAPIIPSGIYFIFLLFPVSGYGFQTIVSPGHAAIARLGGLSVASSGIFFAMLARYGIRDLLNSRHFFRLSLFVVCAAIGLFGGFRSILVEFMIVFAVLFYLEGLMRTRLLPVLLLAIVLSGTLLVAFANKLPLNVQRTLSVLPIDVDPVAKADAQTSTEWRLNMWRDVLPTVPKYLLIGKGYGVTVAEMRILTVARPGEMEKTSAEGSATAGDFHNGPLSLLIPFGIWGAIGFLWFIAAGWRVLHRNYQFGHPAFRRLNRFLFAFFIMKTIFFFLVFGSLYSDLAFFTGLVGLSVSINGGVAQPFLVPRPRAILPPLRFRPQVPQPARVGI